MNSAHVGNEGTKRMAERPLFPGWIARLVIGLMVCLVVAIRLLARTSDPPRPLNDPAIVNILTLIFSFVAVLALWVWFVFRSGYSQRARYVVLAAPVVLVPALFGLFRLVEVSGSMVPRFEPRWRPRSPDAQLGKIEAGGERAVADLQTTTPDDFPQFLGPERSCWVAGPELATDWSAAPPKPLWKRQIGAGWSAFSAVNGYAVTLEQRGGDEWVTCYEIATGNPVWGHAIQARHENPLGGIGPRSTPTIHAGRVYALGATGVLRCLDGGTGKLIWSDDLRKRYGLSAASDEALVQWGRAGSPLIVDGLVIVPGGGPKGEAKNLVAFDADTGRVVWASENRKADGAADQISYASPALATLAGRRQIVIVNESTASGHDPASGQRLWTHDWPGSSSTNASSSQAVATDASHVLLTKGYSGGAELIEITNKTDGGLTTETAWKVPRVLQTKFTNVVVHGGHAYGLSEGILECVDLANGRRKWKSGRYEHGQILGVGDLLLVMSEEGELHLVAANPTKFEHLTAFPALEGKTWNNLCLFGRRLLVRNGQEAACYELP
jgi:outer membrane protein assembly factor BamB